MKIIVSTLNLQKLITSAMNIDANSMRLEYSDNILSFSKGSKERSITISYCPKHHTSFDKRIFDTLQWYKIREFIKQLPEQPIVLEFKDFGDHIEIELSQFIAIF